jgi:hypothetical protein
MFATIVYLDSWLYKSNVCDTAGSRKPIVAVTNEPVNDITFPSWGTLAAIPAAKVVRKVLVKKYHRALVCCAGQSHLFLLKLLNIFNKLCIVQLSFDYCYIVWARLIDLGLLTVVWANCQKNGNRTSARYCVWITQPMNEIFSYSERSGF